MNLFELEAACKVKQNPVRTGYPVPLTLVVLPWYRYDTRRRWNHSCGELLDPQPQIIGVGVNCTRPELIASLIGELTAVTKKPILVYPNSGEQWDAVHRCWQGDGQIQAFGELAGRWRGAGAQWIGGCCRTGPEHVRAAARVWRG